MKTLNIIILCLLLTIVYIAVGNNTIFADGFSGMKTTPAEDNQWETSHPISVGAAIPTTNKWEASYTTPAKVVEIVSTPRPTPISTPRPTPIYGYDNIIVDHTITLCNKVSDDEYAITGLYEKNCGNPSLILDNYPLDLLPSGGNSGKASASEMILVKVITNGHISLIPWETQPVEMRWYDGSDNRLMYTGHGTANSFNNEVGSFIGHFSWEINKRGQYYIDVTVEDFGSARVVFDVT